MTGSSLDALTARPARALAAALGRVAVRDLQARLAGQVLSAQVYIEQRGLALGVEPPPEKKPEVPVPDELAGRKVPDWWRKG